MMNGGLLKQGRYYKSKGLLHTISVTNLYGEMGCVQVTNNGVFAQGSKRITYEKSHLGSAWRTL